jgi:hypothetical protein
MILWSDYTAIPAKNKNLFDIMGEEVPLPRATHIFECCLAVFACRFALFGL